MRIDLSLKYPLHLRRYGDGRILIVDMAWTEVAVATDYDQAWEVVRLANCAWKLMYDLSQKRPYETVDTGKQPRNLGLSEQQIYENPAKTLSDT